MPSNLAGNLAENPDQEEEEKTSDRSQDLEILTMGRILKQLSKLDEPARCRIMAYLADRYKQAAL